MKKTILISALLIAAVWGVYFYNFGWRHGLSTSKEVWGQFGDYAGGVINPLLTFITIILLIKSLNEQQAANQSLINEAIRQEKLDDFKRFESKFYNLIELQQKGFDSFFIYSAPNNSTISLVTKLESNFASKFLEEKVMAMVDAQSSHDEIRTELEKCDTHENLYSIVRRFYLLVKIIDDKLELKYRDEYYETLLNLTDVKLLTLICMMVSYYDYDNTRYILDSKILDKDGLKELIEYFSQD
ncbi:hypothetical protein [Pantoea vagans]|uniref:hypothetical protein n=1 Tax=Pantoea vagans TaxID=470934 RepID=UPI003209D993